MIFNNKTKDVEIVSMWCTFSCFKTGRGPLCINMPKTANKTANILFAKPIASKVENLYVDAVSITEVNGTRSVSS